MKIEMSRDEACSALQINKEAIIQNVFINFKSMTEQRVFPKGKDQAYIIAARNAIILPIYHAQLFTRGWFEIGVPYDKSCTCPRCNGLGLLLKLIAVEMHAKYCNACHGEKFVWIPCRKCDATGRFKIDERDLRINVKCKACQRFEEQWPKGKEFHYKVRCRDCRGLDMKMRYIGIESTTTCPECKGLGFFPKVVENPVIVFGSIAQAIEKVEPEVEYTPENRICELHEADQEKIKKMFTIK